MALVGANIIGVVSHANGYESYVTYGNIPFIRLYSSVKMFIESDFYKHDNPDVYFNWYFDKDEQKETVPLKDFRNHAVKFFKTSNHELNNVFLWDYTNKTFYHGKFKAQEPMVRIEKRVEQE